MSQQCVLSLSNCSLRTHSSAFRACVFLRLQKQILPLAAPTASNALSLGRSAPQTNEGEGRKLHVAQCVHTHAFQKEKADSSYSCVRTIACLSIGVNTSAPLFVCAAVVQCEQEGRTSNTYTAIRGAPKASGFRPNQGKQGKAATLLRKATNSRV